MVFSVALPVLNQAAFIPTALASLSAQRSGFELAVMDATPNNSVQDILAAYRGRICYSRHGKDRGQSAAIQEGWDHTTGDILYWLCADDYLFPYTFSEVENIFNTRPDVDVVYGDSVYVDADGQFIRYFPTISDDVSRLVRECSIAQPSCFVRRYAVERVGKINPDLHFTMDWDLWIRLFKSGAKFYYLRKPLSAIRIYPGTKTTSSSDARFSEIRRHISKNVGFLEALRTMVYVRSVGNVYPELRSDGAKRYQGGISAVLKFARATKRVLRKQNDGIRPKELYGLNVSNNEVQSRCHVYLPAYDGNPNTIAVSTDRNIKLSAAVNGFPVSRISVSNNSRAYRFDLAVAARLRDQQPYVCIDLENTESQSWRLLSVSLPHSSKATPSKVPLGH